ncbi:nucleotide pyrophosphatase [Endozoicomonas sp. OPT23]|uniref:alkaline phosphatase family protein n=1 Tax=Endozoicomonas sp. OPT23 TaxID=2072845 RepID=UPI00129B469E|nr:alkaline phosphatase family protein [Endozoicomonas sp. OPT23]MRI31788.1 nucleotide pyrophosphatase [Endozoicomonas sp. OPT23]
MSNKVILIILDGLKYESARDCMGYMQALCQGQQATLYQLECELPSLSRPLYEAVLTGTPPVQSGILHNHVSRNSTQTSIFSLARDAGLTTAAAAYHWVSELYNRTPYNPVRDRHTSDKEQLIQHGCFYHLDHYPDDHLFLDAEYLRQTYDPDFLLIHPMNIDDAGHKAGGDSSHYRNKVRHTDGILSDFIPQWLEQGYQILVTADHGMNGDNSHGGNLPEERQIPLFVMGQHFSHQQQCQPKQTELCGIACELLGINNHGKPVSEKLLATSKS